MATLDNKENRRVLPDESSAVFAPPAVRSGIGRLLFVRQNTLMAQPFDAEAGHTAGDVVPVAEGVSFFDVNSFAPIAVSENGILLYSTGGGANQIIPYDRSGKRAALVGPAGPIYFPSLSPDNKWVLYVHGWSGAARSIWKRDLNTGADTRLTLGPQDYNPIWSPNGDFILFARSENGIKLYRKPASGSGTEDLLLSSSHFLVPDQWSLNGRFLVYTDQDPKTQRDLSVLPIGAASGQPKPIPFLHSDFNEMQGQLSPDGRWMAYTSDESGQREVYLQPFPAANDKRRVSVAGGEQPRWRRDGKELFFIAEDGKMMAAAVKTAKDFLETGAPQPMFATHMFGLGTLFAFNYDVSADAKQFIVNTTAESGSAPLTVTVNWLSAIAK